MYAVWFEDDPSRAHLRAQHMPEHLAFLDRNAASVLAAGPLADGADGAPAGGLWIVRAETPQQVRVLVEDDPLWPTGLRRSVRILAWTRVFADGKRLLRPAP